MLRPVAAIALASLAGLRRSLGLQLGSEEPIQVTWDAEEEILSVDDPSASPNARVRRRGETVQFSNGSHCLTFVHIPKTGGTFVESKRSTGAEKHEPWGAHDVNLKCRGLGQTGCPPPHHRDSDRCCPMEDGSSCSVWHIPPTYDDLLDASYRHGDCDTFCVVREPAARFRSEHVWRSNFDYSIEQPACSTSSLDAAVESKMEQLEQSPYMDDCHLVPQSAYYDHGRGCKHVIKHEQDFIWQFLQLMAKYDIPVAFKGQAKPLQPKLLTNCHANFSRSSLEKIHKYYSKDYSLFGYPRVLPAE